MKTKFTPTCQFTVRMELTEQEGRALCAITRYGVKSFLETFYAHLGKQDLEKNEEGLKSLFNSIDADLYPQIKDLDKAWKAFMEIKKGDSK